MSKPEADQSRPTSDQRSPRDSPRWSAGIVNHGGFDDLTRCIGSLTRQSAPPSEIFVYDTGIDSYKLDSIQADHRDVIFEVGENLGYAGGANRVIEQLMSTAVSPQFCLVLNPDVELDPDFSSRILGTMLDRPHAAIGGGMLIRPGRLTIDSAGISFPRHGRPRDRGSEQRDRGQYNQVELVDAISGAAMMIRSESFRTLSMGGEIFDESFFAYHEDTDLCWRARRLGWSVLFDPSAVAVHTRGWRKDRRGEIDVRIRRHSFKNHYLQLTKNQTRSEFIKNLPWLMVWEVLRIGFVLVKDRQMLPAYRDALKAMPGALAKRRELNRRVAKSGQNTRTDR